MRSKLIAIISLGVLSLSSCENNEETGPQVNVPRTYSFERGGKSTVTFTGQTTRIRMAEELIAAMKNFDNTTEQLLLDMYRNQSNSGGNVDPFSDNELNASSKTIKLKTAASRDLFFSNATESAEIKADFEDWMAGQINEIFPFENELAQVGAAGQLADGNTTRWVNGKGLEYDQAVGKSLIGALMLDQMLNNYLSTSVLDEGDNRLNNDNNITLENQAYTNMEHKWDEAYGYLFGNARNQTEPLLELGTSDSFLNKYLGRVEGDEDFTGIAEEVYNALKLGRAAIVEKEYEVRDAQAAIIRQKMSELIGIRAVYYLQQGKNAFLDNNYGTAFHDFSECFGFIYSLRFTRNPNTGNAYFSKTEIDGFLNDLYGSTNGFWDLNEQTLDSISESIAAKFDFTVDQAGS